MKAHWTAKSVKDYIFRIAADFIAQLESKMDSLPISQDELAKRLGVTKGRVSQLINHPGNISLAKMIEYAKALGMKVSIVAYEDNDPENKKGPIDSEIFRICWEQLGRPRDFWDAQGIVATKAVFAANITFGRRSDDFRIFKGAKSTSADVIACPPFFAIESSQGTSKIFEDSKPT
jgi:transcriptional regulator with XRE-family HTH domain